MDKFTNSVANKPDFTLEEMAKLREYFKTKGKRNPGEIQKKLKLARTHQEINEMKKILKRNSNLATPTHPQTPFTPKNISDRIRPQMPTQSLIQELAKQYTKTNNKEEDDLPMPSAIETVENFESDDDDDYACPMLGFTVFNAEVVGQGLYIWFPRLRHTTTVLRTNGNVLTIESKFVENLANVAGTDYIQKISSLPRQTIIESMGQASAYQCTITPDHTLKKDITLLSDPKDTGYWAVYFVPYADYTSDKVNTITWD
jgi:hypothetical protein